MRDYILGGFGAIIIGVLTLVWVTAGCGGPVPGTVVGSTVTTGDTANTFPVADTGDLKGGAMQFQSTSARNALPLERRKAYMTADCADTKLRYQLYSCVTNRCWRKQTTDLSSLDPRFNHLSSQVAGLRGKPVITSFTLTPSYVEIGRTNVSVTAEWTYESIFPLTSQSILINDIDGTSANWSIATSQTSASVTVPGNISGEQFDVTFLLSLSNSKGTAVSNFMPWDGYCGASYFFRRKSYYGASSVVPSSITQATIKALSSELSTCLVNIPASIDCSGGKYVYLAAPISGFNSDGIVVKVNGVRISDYTVTPMSITNTYGYYENYNVVSLNNKQYGILNITWGNVP